MGTGLHKLSLLNDICQNLGWSDPSNIKLNWYGLICDCLGELFHITSYMYMLLHSPQIFGFVAYILTFAVYIFIFLGLMLNVPLSRTQLILTHGLFLKKVVDPAQLGSQVSYV